uniref:CD276 molecule n=1 Tax=Cyprinus carpio TaxID=7962 RepID=A0A8C2EI59_CYPCA
LISLLSVSLISSLDVRVPESPAVALFGTDAVLNCSFSGVSEFNLSELSVFWQLSDTKRAVHSFWQSRDQLSDQEERFSNRTSLFPDQLPAGNASLLLRRVRVADEGSYLCFVRVQTYGSGAMLMQVAGNQSQITRDIQDASGHISILSPPLSLTGGRNKFYRGNNNTYFSLFAAQGLVFPPLALWLTVALAVCLLALLVALAAVCRRKIRESCEEMRAEVKFHATRHNSGYTRPTNERTFQWS